MNRYAIELYFDVETQNALTDMWQRLSLHLSLKPHCASRGYVPHISLLVAASLDPERVVPVVRDFARQNRPLEVSLSHFGIFNNVASSLWLGPTQVTELRRLHAEICSRSNTLGVDWSRHYLPEFWVPHCSLLADRAFDACVRGLSLCGDISLPLVGRLESVALVDFIEGTEFLVEPFGS